MIILSLNNLMMYCNRCSLDFYVHISRRYYGIDRSGGSENFY